MRLGVDIGGTKTEVVLLDEQQAVVARHRAATGQGNAALLESTLSAVAEVLGAGSLRGQVESIGVGIPGRIVAGTVHNAENLSVASFDLGSELLRHWELAPTLTNDVNAAARGHWHLSAMEQGILAFLNLGTGLATGVVVNGTIWRGATGIAGEIGYISVDPEGPADRYGLRGGLETYASSSGVAQQGGRTVHEAEKVLAEDAAVRERYYFGVASALRIITLTYDPDTIVLGGGLTTLNFNLLDSVGAVLRGWERTSPLLKNIDMLSRVQLSNSNDPAAAIGAALIGAELG